MSLLSLYKILELKMCLFSFRNHPSSEWEQLNGDKWQIITGNGLTILKFVETGLKGNETITK